MEAFLGDFVITKKYRYRGRVYAKYHNAKGTNEEDWWFEQQQIPFTQEEMEGRWYSILCENGGSVLVPENDILEIEEPYELKNNWESNYFR